MINKQLIPFIEKALDIKLYNNVIQYLTEDKPIYIQNARRYGKTIAYIIKFILENKDKSILITDLRRGKYSDEIWDTNYDKWYFNEFMDIWHKLKLFGFEVVKITYNNGKKLSVKNHIEH